MPPKSTRAQRVKKSAKKAGQLIASGAVSLANVEGMKLSRTSLESGLQQSKTSTPVARHISLRLTSPGKTPQVPKFDGGSTGTTASKVKVK